MFDLQTGIDLQETDRPVAPDEEFAGTGTDVARFPKDRLRSPIELLLLLRCEERGRSLLHELLVPALKRAVTRRDDHYVAVGIGETLRLDMTGPIQVALHEAFPAPESGGGLTYRRFVQFGDVLVPAHHLDPTAPATIGGRDGDGQPVLLGEALHFCDVLDRLFSARDQGRTDLLRDLARRDLVAQSPDH